MVEILGMEVEVGEPVAVGSLRVFPLFSCEADVAYVAGPEAFEKALVEVGELDPPQVPSLVVGNRATVPLLLVEGETLLGATQNRTLNVTVLCDVAAQTVVPVSCVEAGRWGSRRVVARSRSHLSGSIRAAKTENLAPAGGEGAWRTDQGRVWQEVDRQAMRHGVLSETSAFEDVQEAVISKFEGDLAALEPSTGQTGVACAVGDRVVGIDVFGKAETLAGYLRSIVSGYALDASDDVEPTCTIREVERFLRSVAEGKVTDQPTVGIGRMIRIDGDETGVGLRVGDSVLHLAAFPRPMAAL